MHGISTFHRLFRNQTTALRWLTDVLICQIAETLEESCPVIEKHRRASGRNGEAKGNVATALKSKATADRDGEKHCPARQWKCIEEPWKSTDQSCSARQCNGMAESRDARPRNCLDKQRKGDERKSFDCKGKPQNR